MEEGIGQTSPDLSDMVAQDRDAESLRADLAASRMVKLKEAVDGA